MDRSLFPPYFRLFIQTVNCSFLGVWQSGNQKWRLLQTVTGRAIHHSAPPGWLSPDFMESDKVDVANIF